MSRSGYDYYGGDYLDIKNWRGAVASAMRGKRGQAFLREMAAALDAMPWKRLIAYELEDRGEVCAIGAVGRCRGIDMSDIDPHDPYQVAKAFGIPRAMACEIEFMNDEQYSHLTPERRWERMRAWIEAEIEPPLDAKP